MFALKSTHMSLSSAIARIIRANLIAGAVGSIVVAAPAFAQQASKPAPQSSSAQNSLDEVIITVRRIDENLQKVPVAVTALTPTALEQQSIQRIEDLPRAVPGFTTEQSFQSATPVYTIRGQHGDPNATANTEPAVQVYFAEMNQARSQGTAGSFFDLASVQVLKGPQGTLFGRNSTGGALLITPKAPENDFGGYVRGSFGNLLYHDFEGAVNIPLGDGEKAALRIGGKSTRREGYMKNISTGEDGGELNNDSARVSLRLSPTDAITSTFIYTYFKSDIDGTTIKLDSVDPHVLSAFNSPTFPLGSILFSLWQQDAASSRALGPYRTNSPNNPFSKDKVTSLQNNTEIELTDNMTLKNILGYRRATQDQGSDFYGGSIDNFWNTIDSTADLYSEELQLQGDVDKLDYVLGVYALRERVDLKALARVFGSFLDLGIPGFNFAFPFNTLADNNYSTDSYSAFAHGNYDLSSLVDGFSVSAGLRFTRDNKKATFRTFNADGDPAGIVGYTCTLTGGFSLTEDLDNCSTPSKIHSSQLTYDISLNYQLTPDALIYLAHRHGYRAGGFDIIPPTPNVLSFKPETVNDFELGTKLDLHIGDMPVRVNAAAYYQDYKDIQRLSAIRTATNGIANGTANVAAAKIYGGELELTAKPTPALELSATYAYTKAQNKKWEDLYKYVSGVDSSGNPIFTTTTLDISDSYFSYVPLNQWSFTGRYTLPIAAEYGDLAMSVTWYGQSSMHTGEDSTTNCGPDLNYTYCYNRSVAVPAYDLVNLRADWKDIAGQGFDVSLFVNNVSDKTYQNTALALNGALGFTSVGYGAPRTYGLQLTVPFGAEKH